MKLVIDGVEREIATMTITTEDPAVEIPANAVTGPAVQTGPPRSWIKTESEDWMDYPVGPVVSFDPLKWEPKFSHNANFLNGDNEGQVYVTPSVKAKGITYNPFSIAVVNNTRMLAITPKLATATERAILRTLTTGSENYNNKTFLSGVLSSKLSQTYGYYEATHICPAFMGDWAADWLMGPSWWPEFDMMEHLTRPHGTLKAYCAIHYEDAGKDRSSGDDVVLTAPTNALFKLSALWMPNFLAVYFNNKKLWEAPNPAMAGTVSGLHEPAHRVINLALGSPTNTWAGPVTDVTKLAAYYSGKMLTYAMP